MIGYFVTFSIAFVCGYVTCALLCFDGRNDND